VITRTIQGAYRRLPTSNRWTGSSNLVQTGGSRLLYTSFQPWPPCLLLVHHRDTENTEIFIKEEKILMVVTRRGLGLLRKMNGQV
jgi:hypothetical protein